MATERGIHMKTGELITLYRNQAGMTIDELVEKSGVPRGTLNKIISGDTKAPALDKMKAIAKALGKTLNDFARDEEGDLDLKIKTPPSPDKPDQEEPGRSLLSESAVEEILIQLGYIQPGDDLTDADLQFLLGIGQILEAWFRKSEESGSK